MFNILNRIKKALHKIKLKKIKFKEMGKNIEIAHNFKFIYPENITIMEHTYIGPNCTIYAHAEIFISRGTIIGPNLTIYSANHNFSENATSIPYDKKLNKSEICIGENVWIGGNVILLPNTKIGEGSIIGAGSVIAKEIPPFSIVVGNPAKIIGQRNITKYKELKEADLIYMKEKNAKI